MSDATKRVNETESTTNQINEATQTFITTKQLAARWGVSEEKLELDRYSVRGAPFVKLGRHVRYRLSDLLAYERAQTVGKVAS